jgi:hypothetical protein
MAILMVPFPIMLCRYILTSLSSPGKPAMSGKELIVEVGRCLQNSRASVFLSIVL